MWGLLLSRHSSVRIPLFEDVSHRSLWMESRKRTFQVIRHQFHNFGQKNASEIPEQHHQAVIDVTQRMREPPEPSSCTKDRQNWWKSGHSWNPGGTESAENPQYFTFAEFLRVRSGFCTNMRQKDCQIEWVGVSFCDILVKIVCLEIFSASRLAEIG